MVSIILSVALPPVAAFTGSTDDQVHEDHRLQHLTGESHDGHHHEPVTSTTGHAVPLTASVETSLAAPSVFGTAAASHAPPSGRSVSPLLAPPRLAAV